MKTEQANNIKTQDKMNQSMTPASAISKDEIIFEIAQSTAYENQTRVLKHIAKRLTRNGILYMMANVGVSAGLGIVALKFGHVQPWTAASMVLATTPIGIYYGINTLKAAHRIRKLSRTEWEKRKSLAEQYEYDGLLPIYTLCKKLINRLSAIDTLYPKPPVSKREQEIEGLMGINQERIEEYCDYANYCKEIYSKFLKEY